MKRKVVLGMAVFMTAIMVPAQAFAAKPAGGGDYLSGTQEAVESGDLDVDEAIATMMEGFEDVYRLAIGKGLRRPPARTPPE